MMEPLAAAVCTVYGFIYSGYYLTNLACHLRRVFRGADPESPEPTADSSLAPSAPGEEAKEEQNDHEPPALVTPQPEHSETVVLEKEQEQIDLSEMPCQTEGELLPAREQEEQLGQQVEEALENGQNIKAEPQAELPEAQNAIVAVKRRHQEDMRNIQEEMTLYRQRRDQQNKVSDRVAATPLIKLSLSCVLEDSKENLQAEMQDTRARIKEREKRLEEEMKMVEEEINQLIQEKNFLHKQVEMLTSHLSACKGFQQMTGDEEPQGRHKAQQLSQEEMLKVGNVSKMEEKWTHCEESYQEALVPLPEKWSLCNLFISSTDTDAAQPQEDFPELLRRMVNVENPIRKYTELENLGSGAFGEVSRALDIATGGEVAIKKINVQGRIRKEAIAYELMVMKMNRNPNIVTYLESYFVGKHLWLVMEYMDGGTLRDIISETQMSEGEIAVVSRECLQGLDFLHSNHVIHRDVKSCNILLRMDGSVKLADFGLSAQLTPEQRRQISVASTSGWMAPEVVKGHPYGPKMDIWSFGIVGIEMVEREVPSWNETPVSPQLLINIRGTPKLWQPNLFSLLLHDFLNCCLQTDEAQRWSAEELLQHPLVTLTEPVSSLVPLIISVKRRKEEKTSGPA